MVSGILSVRVGHGSDLLAADHNGKSDPYVELSLTALAIEDCDTCTRHTLATRRTNVIKDTLNPVWDHSFVFDLTSWEPHELEKLHITAEVFDHDIVGSATYLGGVELPLLQMFAERGGLGYHAVEADYLLSQDRDAVDASVEHRRISNLTRNHSARSEHSGLYGSLHLSCQFQSRRKALDHDGAPPPLMRFNAGSCDSRTRLPDDSKTRLQPTQSDDSTPRSEDEKSV